MTDILFPCTQDDIEAFYHRYIFDPRIDGYQDGAFVAKCLKSGTISYFCYGEKEFEFRPGLLGTSQLILPPDVSRKLFPNLNVEENKPTTVTTLTSDQLQRLADIIRVRKDAQFRSLGEPFACCNAFEQCSDAKACLYKSEPFYNGCQYRRNLEQGRIFYGKNKTI